MKKLYILLMAVVFAFSIHAQDNTSIPLVGTCLNPDEGTIEFLFDLNANCPEADPNGVLPGVQQMGFHSGANDWSSIVAWDDAAALPAVNNGNDTLTLTVNVSDYYGIAFGDLSDIKMVVNNGFADPSDPWTVALRDSTDGSSFGDPTDCSDLILVISDTPTCSDLSQTSSLVLWSDAGDSETCVDPVSGKIKIDLDYEIRCIEADSTGVLAGAPSLGFHSGANNWSTVVGWDDPSAVELVNNGSDNFSAVIDVMDYYGMPLEDLENINMIANNGPNNPAAAWDVAIRDPKDGGSFGNPNPCSDIFMLVSEAPTCDLSTGTKDIQLQHSFKVAPNPFSNRTFLEFDNPQNRTFSLVITNMSGQIVRTMSNITGERVLVEREDMPAGMFVANLIDEEGNFAITKLIVK